MFRHDKGVLRLYEAIHHDEGVIRRNEVDERQHNMLWVCHKEAPFIATKVALPSNMYNPV